MNPVRYALWRAQALFDTRRLMRAHAVREWFPTQRWADGNNAAFPVTDAVRRPSVASGSGSPSQLAATRR